MSEQAWLEEYFQKVAASSEEGAEAVRFVREKKVRVGLRRARRSVGAFWVWGNSFYLNKAHYTEETALINPRAWTLFVHEVKHLQQGGWVAMSIYGELEAWQVEFRLLKKITRNSLRPELEELLALPLNYERSVLRRARQLMMKFAGFWYGAWLLPLYPLPQEFLFWITRKRVD